MRLVADPVCATFSSSPAPSVITSPCFLIALVNGATKVICVRNLPPSSILAKADLLLSSSGAKIATLKRPKVESTTESVRGMWSQFHAEQS